MYLSHYGLQKKPFDISPDPSFLWLGEKHREALSYLKYGIMENKGFLMITGDVGTGKTALIKRLTRLIDAATFVVTIPDPDMDKLDFFNFLADELGMNRTFKTKGEFLIQFKHFLRNAYSDHRKVLLIIDESQRLNHELLQEIRLLSNIDLGGQVLLNIFFVGQTEFNLILKEERNRTVRQRITASFHLDPLNIDEVKKYVVHRLRIAGANSQIFTDEAIRKVYEHTDGYPRLINILCDHALMTGYASGATAVLPSMVDECAGELSITFGSRHGGAASEAAPESDLILTEDLEPLVMGVPGTDYDQTPAVTSEAVVKQMALAAGERQKSFLQPVALVVAILFMLTGITYFAYKPVSNYIAGLNPTEKETPPLSSFKPKEPGLDAAPQSAAGERIAEATAKPAIAEVPTAYKTTAENGPDAAKNMTIPDRVASDAQEKGSISASQIRSDAEGDKATVEPESATGAANDRIGSPPASGQPVVSSKGGESSPLTASAVSGQARPAEPKRAVIFFEHDSHDLPAEAWNELARLAGAAFSSPKAKISIQGYTDSLGNEWYNRKLSQTRADIVRDFFIKRGVDPEKIKAFGLGSEYPLASNSTVDGRRKNRRVEIYIGSEIN